MLKLWQKFNVWIALNVGQAFSTMECFWLFNLIAISPLFSSSPKFLTVAQYISSGYLQLVALPLLGVVSVIVGKKADTRAEKDHRAIMAELKLVKAMHSDIAKLLAKLDGKME